MDMWFDFLRWIAVLQVEKGKPICVPFVRFLGTLPQ